MSADLIAPDPPVVALSMFRLVLDRSLRVISFLCFFSTSDTILFGIMLGLAALRCLENWMADFLSMCAGWDEGVMQMTLGEKSTLTISP
jgi:hypothetical protein